MMVLIIGGSGSGKSAYAEEYIGILSGECNKYYLATMQVFDEEGKKKVARHQKLRKNKGFLTIEQPIEIEKTLPKIKAGSSVLLECISNLTANEMFLSEDTKKQTRSYTEVTDSVVEGIQSLKQKAGHLVIVTNNVFEDGIVYEEGTMEYLRAIGSINEKLADMADEVIEVVVGITLVIKGGK